MGPRPEDVDNWTDEDLMKIAEAIGLIAPAGDDVGEPPAGWCWEICPCGQACEGFADHRTPHRCWNH